jgi:hypothetical protein
MKHIRYSIVVALLLLAQAAIAQTVYTTKTGKKYHEDGCQYLRQSKIKTDVASAISFGYTACSVCDPPAKATSSQVSGTPIKRAVSQQCSGTTKAGARCKRMTTSANGRCYQH